VEVEYLEGDGSQWVHVGAPVPEIMDSSGILLSLKICGKRLSISTAAEHLRSTGSVNRSYLSRREVCFIAVGKDKISMRTYLHL
jgi:hypothetical protein